MNDKAELCKAFGLDTQNLLAARIDITVNGPITITAKYWTGDRDAEGIITALKKYELKAIGE